MEKVILTIRSYKKEHVYSSDDKYYHILFENTSEYDSFKDEFINKCKPLKENLSEDIDRCIETEGILYRKYFAEGTSLTVISFLNTSGVSHEKLEQGKEISNKILNVELKLREEESKKNGFINYKYPLPADVLYGGFKDHELLTDDVKEYIGNGEGIGGYIGHSGREYYMDEVIKTVHDKYKESRLYLTEELAQWLTSTYARHWMDANEDVSEISFEIAVEELVKSMT